MVDDSDYESISAFRWHIAGIRKDRPNETPKLYAAKCAWVAGKTKIVLMHREIINAPCGVSVDHVDGNGLNNCRSNLRLATQSQNLANMRPTPHSSRYKGVFFNRQPATHRSPWWARIKYQGRNIHIGVFQSERAAAVAYNEYALRLHGEFARLNTLEEETDLRRASSRRGRPVL